MTTEWLKPFFLFAIWLYFILFKRSTPLFKSEIYQRFFSLRFIDFALYQTKFEYESSFAIFAFKRLIYSYFSFAFEPASKFKRDSKKPINMAWLMMMLLSQVLTRHLNQFSNITGIWSFFNTLNTIISSSGFIWNKISLYNLY